MPKLETGLKSLRSVAGAFPSTGVNPWIVGGTY